MADSNIQFATNTYPYNRTKFDESKGDAQFFRMVKDYDALYKLKMYHRMHGSMNSNYYVATKEQLEILDPNFIGISTQFRREDPVIKEQNRIFDLEYGYSENNNYYPLLEEIIIDDSELSYADELLGKWERSGAEDDTFGESPFGFFIRSKADTDTSGGTVRPEDAGFEEIDDKDPYYYLYENVATGKPKNAKLNLDKAKLYEQKYGSIFRAFIEVPQEEIIEAPINQYSFVNAGPGTGKTYTLMKKITYMIDSLGADPEGILVLCFTNAAVNEIKARIKQYAENEGGREFINVDVRTFHSFSWILINQANEIFRDRRNYRYIDISKLNYDQSLLEATRIIRKYGDEVFGNVEHLIVDEIQDLTNQRASLTIEMVKECIKNRVGITVLGDSCQAIYDYTEDTTQNVIKSDEFYKNLFSEFFDYGKFYKLEKNHRQNRELIYMTSPLREAILSGEKDRVRKAIDLLRNDVPELVSGHASTTLSEYNLDRMTSGSTVCLLCRNNAQVLATSNNLRIRGIKHTVNAYNEFEYLSDWIGKVFGLFSKQIISFVEFKNSLEYHTRDYQATEVWERLQDVIGTQNNVLKVSDILSAIAKSTVDDPVFRNIPKGNLIVSNIHRAKGREYGTVVVEKNFVNRLLRELSDKRDKKRDTKEYLEEAKVLYVAVTRPRSRLYFNKLASVDVTLKMIKTGRKRWARGDGRNLKFIEIRALSDADIRSFNSIDIQNYIIENVNEGDEINLVMNNKTMTVSYDIVHVSGIGERIIGKSTTELIDDIDEIITPYDSPWPKRITELYVSGIYSEIDSDFQSVWCWVDFCGLGIASSDVY